MVKIAHVRGCFCIYVYLEKFINGMGGGRTKGRHISDVNGQGYNDCDGGGGGVVQSDGKLFSLVEC